MELVVRPLEASDVEGPAGLERLRASIVTELEAERGGPLFLADRAGRSTESIIEMANQPGCRCDVVLADGALVGWALTTIRRLPNERLIATIEEIAVDAEARAIGAGETLLESTMAWCREMGCDGVDSFALPGARETKNFFETFGLKARLLTVHADLRTDASTEASSGPLAEGA
jgi:N-acetylglutamate synthase-like GNAT family acetyltransferase